MLMPVAVSVPARRVRLAVSVVLVTVAAAVLALSAAPAAHARSRAAGVPAGFVGVDTDGPLFSGQLNLGRQMSSMVSNGVQTVRVAFNWAVAQPYASWSQVPAGQAGQYVTGPAGRPISYASTDAVVANAARHGLTVLPTLLYTPGWDARNNRQGFNVPARTAPFAEFATAMVRRYGPHGSFWSQNRSIPKVPIHMWQIWNEPNIPAYWPQPFAKSYLSLLRISHQAIKSADPRATVVLGALTNLAWRSLGELYRAGARRLFDAVSVNGFTATPADVIEYLRFMRHAMDRSGDAAKPLIATELSWPSAKGQTAQRADYNVTQAGQARNIAALLPMIGAWRTRLGLSAFYYYTWIGNEFKGASPFNFSGLLSFSNRGQVRVKPALGAFRRGALRLEGCRAKGATATRCVR